MTLKKKRKLLVARGIGKRRVPLGGRIVNPFVLKVSDEFASLFGSMLRAIDKPNFLFVARAFAR